MPLMTRLRKQELSNRLTSSTAQHMMDSITLGIVVDTNDPQQMGRVRAVCQRWGDSFDSEVTMIPWAVYSTPFGGAVSVGTRGPGIDDVNGAAAYGMWAVPKVGAQVLVMCIDSDPNQRVYIGCVYDQFVPHTLPHGRFMYDDHPNLDNTITPSGPYSSTEQPIEPTWTNMRQAFGNKTNPNFEWRTRGADYTAAAVDLENLSSTRSAVADDKDYESDGWKSRQGYQTSRVDPTAPTSLTPRNLDSMVYSFTSPGFHSLSMDDRIENSRIRLRTTAGHQIIMDDTNERIYIATARGENWIEMDQAGNIDVFTTSKLNIRAQGSINMTSDEDIRMTAKKGIHMVSHESINLQATQDVHVLAQQNIRLQSTASTLLTSGDTMEMLSGSNLNLTSGLNINHSASGDIIQTASTIHQNGPAATPAKPAAALPARWTNRVPAHEPWPRTMTKDDYSHEPELQYDDKDVGRLERGRKITRGLYWRR